MDWDKITYVPSSKRTVSYASDLAGLGLFCFIRYPQLSICCKSFWFVSLLHLTYLMMTPVKEVYMASKLVRLDFKKEDLSSRETISGVLKCLLTRDDIRKREIERLNMRNLELEEVVFRMNNKIERLFQSSSGYSD